MIVKLGGSLIEKGRDIIRVLKDYAKEKAITIVLIPGGGPFVEPIKKLSKSISEETAHWMAVLAMHQYGLFLANSEVEIPLVESVNEIDWTEPICILLPYKILKVDDSLQHTWDVTSDTIAAFVANKMGEKTIIKLTDVDGIIDEDGLLIKKIIVEEMFEKRERSCIDVELPRFLMQNKMSCIIVNGNFPKRIIDILEGKETISTKLS